MKRKKRLPVPQKEFGFTSGTFNLIVETGLDGQRLTHDREQIEKAHEFADKAQITLLQTEE